MSYHAEPCGLDVTISASSDWFVAIFTTSLESQESYLTLRNLTLQITRDFFRLHSTSARLYNAATSKASRLHSAGSLAIIKCSLRSVLANPGYSTLVLGAGWQTWILATKAGKLLSKRRMRVSRMKMSCLLTSMAADSGSNFDATMKVLQSIQKQNQEIETGLEQQRLKTELLVEDLSQRFKELCTRVNNQASQLETELKLHGDKLTVKINALEEDFVNKVEFLDSKQRSFEEDVKEWLKGTQEKFDSQLRTSVIN